MPWERVYLSEGEQSNALHAADSRDCTRNDMAEIYADCIIADGLARLAGRARVDFAIVNRAILRRWPKGLTCIKEHAWRIVEMREVRIPGEVTN